MKINTLLFLLLATILVRGQGSWYPPNPVPEVVNCNIGDVAKAVSVPYIHIEYCPTFANQLNSMFPGVGHFFYVHEYGHVILQSSDEARVDRWAAGQLANITGGYYYINAFLSYMYYRNQNGEGPAPGYGTPLQRAQRVINAVNVANTNLVFLQESGQFTPGN